MNASKRFPILSLSVLAVILAWGSVFPACSSAGEDSWRGFIVMPVQNRLGQHDDRVLGADSGGNFGRLGTLGNGSIGATQPQDLGSINGSGLGAYRGDGLGGPPMTSPIDGMSLPPAPHQIVPPRQNIRQ